jgi:hypothetical protein
MCARARVRGQLTIITLDTFNWNLPQKTITALFQFRDEDAKR